MNRVELGGVFLTVPGPGDGTAAQIPCQKRDVRLPGHFMPWKNMKEGFRTPNPL